ncbi:MAG: toprim domain-containing protein [Pleurocapsa sp. MO_226.B13]|nr:toprim domain-containing protein [Pleurocapsa sp. MO_226.B13]
MGSQINTKAPIYSPEIIDEVRQFNLEEVAERLGMERDCEASRRHRHDQKKWRTSGCAISIDASRGVFFDHLAQTGSGGAISLVTHVMQCDFVTAMDFLWGKPVDFTPKTASKIIQAKVKEPEKLPRCNRRDRTKWKNVREYLIDRRGLPSFLVDTLHRQGLIDADVRSNAMFFRYSIESGFQLGEAIGASLRSISSNLKLLTPGTKRDRGWFFFGIGEGIVRKIFLVESPIDAISLAALRGDSIYGRTIYISIDGAGSIPLPVLTDAVRQGAKIIIALDGDRPGEEMSWRIAKQLPLAIRMRPILGKDWNEQLLGSKRYLPTSENWSMFAAALGKDEREVQRIGLLMEKKVLSTAEKEMLWSDWQAYSQRKDELWQWYRQAEVINKPDEYLQRIAEVAIAFNQQQPVPLSERAIEAMQKDLLNRVVHTS